MTVTLQGSSSPLFSRFPVTVACLVPPERSDDESDENVDDDGHSSSSDEESDMELIIE